MTHDELLALLKDYAKSAGLRMDRNAWLLLGDVAELHKPMQGSTYCDNCCRMGVEYPCSTIQVIKKELE